MFCETNKFLFTCVGRRRKKGKTVTFKRISNIWYRISNLIQAIPFTLSNGLDSTVGRTVSGNVAWFTCWTGWQNSEQDRVVFTTVWYKTVQHNTSCTSQLTHVNH